MIIKTCVHNNEIHKLEIELAFQSLDKIQFENQNRGNSFPSRYYSTNCWDEKECYYSVKIERWFDKYRIVFFRGVFECITYQFENLNEVKGFIKSKQRYVKLKEIAES